LATLQLAVDSIVLAHTLIHTHSLFLLWNGLCKCNKLHFIMKILNAWRLGACSTAAKTTTKVTKITTTTASNKNPINCYFICLLYSDYATTAIRIKRGVLSFCVLIYCKLLFII